MDLIERARLVVVGVAPLVQQTARPGPLHVRPRHLGVPGQCHGHLQGAERRPGIALGHRAPSPPRHRRRPAPLRRRAPGAPPRRRRRRRAGSRRHSVARLSSGEFTEKNGFSVVAPMRTTRPSSTAGSSASCCALLKRWTSSMKRMVPRSVLPEAAAGVVDGLAHVGHAGAHRREGHERLGRRAGHHRREGGLARARGSPQDRPRSAGPVRPGRAAARPARPDGAGRPCRRACAAAGAPPAGRGREGARRPPAAKRSRGPAPGPRVPRPARHVLLPRPPVPVSPLPARPAARARGMPRGASALGAPVMGSVPDWVFGKAMTSRMFSSPASSATKRSTPTANPP